jgi:hypothetical protein
MYPHDLRTIQLMRLAAPHEGVLMSTFFSYVPARLSNPHGAEIPHPRRSVDSPRPNSTPSTHHEVITQAAVRNKIFSLSYHYV